MTLQKIRNFFYCVSFFMGVFVFSSCAVVRQSASPDVLTDQAQTVTTSSTDFYQKQYDSLSVSAERRNITHQVAPGETLWRLAKVYDVPAKDIIRENNLKSEQDLRIGQILHISQAASAKDIVQLYPSEKWEYIIIHHSATDVGSSLDFNKAHLQKGWDQGVGYHFVIDNGSRTKRDGQIEVTPRWIKQLDGAHCKAFDMNRKAIGICLVGNFNIGHMTNKQFQSLVDLVNTLRKYYHIPLRNIMGHGQVEGALTDCPGKGFPWREFQNRLVR